MKHPYATKQGWQIDGDSAEAYERYLAAAFGPWASRLVDLADLDDDGVVCPIEVYVGVARR
jgi:hypothetical protein